MIDQVGYDGLCAALFKLSMDHKEVREHQAAMDACKSFIKCKSVIRGRTLIQKLVYWTNSDATHPITKYMIFEMIKAKVAIAKDSLTNESYFIDNLKASA